MNKILKTSLTVLAGILFFGVNYATTPAALAVTIDKFVASPATINNGGTVTFTWSSNSDGGCGITGGNIPSTPNPDGTVGLQGPASGTLQYPVTIDNTQGPKPIEFSLACYGWLANKSIKATVTVNPVVGTRPVVQISANPAQLAADDSTKKIVISWQASNSAPSACVASGPGNFVGPKDPIGSLAIDPAQAGTYRLTCTNPTTNETATGSVAVTKVITPAEATQDANLGNLECGFSLMGGSISISACLTIGAYYAFYKPAALILTLAVYLFDAVLSMSISNQFINRPFISDLWVLIRNFSNMIFIFVLIYAGVQTMLGFGDWRKTVIKVIVVALLINFSLFFTKVVIDAGNVLAVGVYTSMGTPSTVGVKTNTSDVGERGIATAIAGQFQPQRFLGAAGAAALNDPFQALVIFMVAAFVSGAVAYIFFKALFIFIGRIIAFWFLMVSSPFAFVSITMPKGNIFSWWTDTLIDQAFMAPVFLFLIYMVMQVVTAGGGLLSGMVDESTGTAGFVFDKLIIPIIMAAMIYVMLDKALSVAKKMGGDFGSTVSKYVGQAVGTVATVALGAATGGASLAAGKMGAAAMASGAMQKGAVSGNVFKRSFSKLGLLAADKAQNATFDPRNIGGGIGKGISGLGLGKGNKMTYGSQTKDWREGQEKRAEHMAGLMETPKEAQEKLTASERGDVVQAERDVAALDRGVAQASKAADATPQGQALINAQRALTGEEKKLEEATKKEAAAADNLAKILADPTRIVGGQKETAARDAHNQASIALNTSKVSHSDAKNVFSGAKASFDTTPEAAALASAQTKHKAEYQKAQDELQRRKAVLEKKMSEIEEENRTTREVYAGQVETGGIQITRGGRERARERAEKIRKNTPASRKEKNEEARNMAKLAKALMEQQKKDAAAAGSPPTP